MKEGREFIWKNKVSSEFIVGIMIIWRIIEAEINE